MDAATLDVLVAWTLSSCGHGCCVAWTLSSCGHGCCDIGSAGSMDIIIRTGVDAATLDVLVAWTLARCGHGCCDTGCADSSTDVIKGQRPGAQNTGGPIDSSKNLKRAPPAGVRRDAGSEG